MKHLFNILLLTCATSALMAQDFDRITIADTDIQGTARYVAMSGAFAALGGDVSAVQDNPAALGVFRRSELSITSDWRYNWNKTPTQTNWGMNHKWTVPQVALVWSFGNPQKQKGMISNTFTLQYHRLKSYTNPTRLESSQVTSYTDWMAVSATEQKVSWNDMSGHNVWDNENIGWLSALGATVGLIDTVVNTPDQWGSILAPDESVTSALEVREYGALDAYTLGWGSNISNRVYVGLSANMNLLDYTKQTFYNEAFQAGGGFTLHSNFRTKGIGFNVAAGVIYRPLDFLRLGASFQTPTWMDVQTANYANIKTEGLPQSPTTESSTYTCEGHYLYTDYLLPMRAVAGVAFQVSKYGLLSLEYDYTHSFDHATFDTHWLRFGTEWIVANNWFFRAGYAYKSDFGANQDAQLLWAYNTTRTDMDFRIKQWEQYASAGLGYRNKRWVIDVAYQCQFGQIKHYMIEDWAVHDVQSQAHRIVVTFAWTQR